MPGRDKVKTAPQRILPILLAVTVLSLPSVSNTLAAQSLEQMWFPYPVEVHSAMPGPRSNSHIVSYVPLFRATKAWKLCVLLPNSKRQLLAYGEGGYSRRGGSVAGRGLYR